MSFFSTLTKVGSRCCLAALLSGLAAGAAPPQASEAVALPREKPLVVTGSTRVRPGEYLRASSSEGEPVGVILLTGLDGVTLDLTGVVLRGAPPGTDLDHCLGFGVVIDDCRDVTIRGGRIGGYKGCLVVRDSTGVVIEGVEFDGWYGERLSSTIAAENPADWLRPSENDRGEWLDRYGAAIRVADCREVTIRDCRGRRGQNGILLERSTECRVYDNDFSFLSGWGLGLHRSWENVVAHNIFDYCVRGYSHDIYGTGQNSAGILVFERSSDNVFARNSATHGGDGASLFAGRDLVEGRARERGELDAGGSDGNLWFENDLRYAVGNGYAGTFSSRNTVIGNKLSGARLNGIRIGYSSGTLIAGNEIDGAVGGGITIANGQDCLVAGNLLHNNPVALEVYWDADPELVEGPFGKVRDTTSNGHWVTGNTLTDNDTDLNLYASNALTFAENRFSGTNRALEISDSGAEGDEAMHEEEVREWLQGIDGSLPSGRISQTTIRSAVGREHARRAELQAFEAPAVPGTQVTALEERGETGGLDTIVMGEWGPWDFRSGEPRPPARYPGGALSEARWDASWFHWDRDTVDPRGDLDAWRALRYEPVVRDTVGNWFNPWGSDGVRDAVGSDLFGLIATTRAIIEESGGYRLTVGSDDGVRLSIDGFVVFEDWTWHAAKTQSVTVELERGVHTFDLEYFQIDGAAALSVDLELVGE